MHHFLFPHKWRRIGIVLALPGFALFLLQYWDVSLPFLTYAPKQPGAAFLSGDFLWNAGLHNYTNELAAMLFLSGLLLIAFSREKTEDERTRQVRLESLVWAVYVNTLLVMLAILLTYGGLFLNVMVYNICTPLVFFVLRFRWILYKDGKLLKTEHYAK